VRVVKQREGGIVRRVALIDDVGDEVVPVSRFLSHLADSAYSPNTVCAYAYDLRHVTQFLNERSLTWNDFRPSTALEFLGYLRRVPCRLWVPRTSSAAVANRRVPVGVSLG